jgi:hypothetical protein
MGLLQKIVRMSGAIRGIEGDNPDVVLTQKTDMPQASGTLNHPKQLIRTNSFEEQDRTFTRSYPSRSTKVLFPVRRKKHKRGSEHAEDPGG